MDESDSLTESGKIYRDSVGVICFVCVHCGNYFEDINDILDCIESHFSERIESEEVLESYHQPMETTELLEIDEMSTDSREYVSIAADSLKIEPNDASVDWSEESSIITKDDAKSLVSKNSGNKIKTFNCPHCSEYFTQKILLVAHTKTHHSDVVVDSKENIFKCDKCFLIFDTHSNLDNHLNEEHMAPVTIDLKVGDASQYLPEDSVECDICRRRFKGKRLLKRHLQRSTCKDEFCFPVQVGEFPFYCDICSYGFPHKFLLIRHMNQNHIGQENQCKYCDQKYVLETCLQKHEMYDCPQRPGADEVSAKKVVRKRPILSDAERDAKVWDDWQPSKNLQGSNVFNCEFCDRSYKSRYKLKDHLLTHANLQEFKCDQCDRAYNTKYRLRKHYLANHTDRPTFDCEVCGRKFRENNNLKRHMRLHNGDYQAQCQLCQKNFTARCQLKYHMVTAHSNETPYQCDICGKSYNSRSKMNVHRSRHIKETLPCDICDKIFGNKERLYTHKKTHTEERNIICKECGKNFKTAVVLKQHMYLHKGKNFKCNFCSMTFAQSSGRRTHERLRHNIV